LETLRLGQGNAAKTRRASAARTRSKLDATGRVLHNRLISIDNFNPSGLGDFSDCGLWRNRVGADPILIPRPGSPITVPAKKRTASGGFPVDPCYDTLKGNGRPLAERWNMAGPVRILISSCLLGEPVRYDGGHKRDGFLVETLGRFVEWIPICPEVDCGLPTPREAMRLVGGRGSPRLVSHDSGIDHTDRMLRWSRLRLEELAALDLCGYICKEDSPSSGMARVRVYKTSGVPARTGAGIFTKAFMDRFPLIPVEEEGRLRDPVLREMFLEKVFTLRRFRELLARRKSRGGLIAFHTDHKLLVLSHGRKGYTELGRLVARAKEIPIAELFDRYQRLLMEAFSVKPTPKKVSDVLLHMIGHLRNLLTVDEKRELLDSIDRYRNRMVPLIVPVTLLSHHVRKHRVEYLARQRFLDPHPAELMLRNHV